VQRSATHFTRYTYRAQQVDSSQLVASTWQPLLAKLGRGHYQTMCESISIPNINWLLMVKQGAKLTYSVRFTDYYALDFTALNRARLVPAITLVQRLLK
jgi:hypothetical protein